MGQVAHLGRFRGEGFLPRHPIDVEFVVFDFDCFPSNSHDTLYEHLAGAVACLLQSIHGMEDHNIPGIRRPREPVRELLANEAVADIESRVHG